MSNLRTRATAHDPIAILLQPLDSSCHYQSVKRGFAISLPILIIYLLIYLLNIVPWESKLGQQYRGTVTRFWAYRRQEGFDNIANLCTYVTSQFTHGGLIPLVLDSLVLIGVASILGLVFNRRTFFAVYVLGGFLAAAADCTWARITNPCRCITQAELDQNLTFARLINEALHKKAEIIASSQLFTMRGFVRLLTNTGELSWTAEELDKQNKVIKTYYPQTRDWDRWIMQNYAASGSLACLLSVATLIRPRTIINFMGVRPSVLLFKLTLGLFVFNLYMPLATNSRLNHLDCVGGNLAAVLLWFLWLRRGRMGALASSVRAFDKVNKPARKFPVDWLFVFAVLAETATVHTLSAAKAKAQDSKAARAPDPFQPADETGKAPTEETKEDAANDRERERQEGIVADRPAAGKNDEARENDNE